MMTPEQNKEIVDFLFSKKLPLDLLVEVEDHMKEQIFALMEEGVSFENAFKQTKLHWQQDLQPRWMLFRGKRTRLEKETARHINREKNLTALKWTLPYAVLVVFLTFYQPEMAKFTVIAANFVVGLYCLYLIAGNYKLFQSASGQMNRRNISVLQRKCSFLVFGAEGVLFNVWMTMPFERFQTALYKIPHLNFNEWFSLTVPFVFIYGGIMGFLYFNDYKKAVHILKEKINLKI